MRSFPTDRLTAGVLLAFFAVACVSSRAAQPERTVRVDELDLAKMTVGYGRVQRNLSLDGKPLSIGGRKYARGVGTHAPSVLKVRLQGGAARFRAEVGVDDEVGARRGSVEFIVAADGRERWRSGLVEGGQRPKAVNVDLRGAQEVVLRVTEGGDGGGYDHADWANAEFTVTGAAPAAVSATSEVRIETARSALVFLVGDDNRLYQQHYGAKAVQPEPRPDRAREAYPAAGNGWLFEPALQVAHADGNTSTDLRFVGSRTERIDANTTETRIELKDTAYPFLVTLVFRGHRAEDVVQQWTEIQHTERGRATLSRFASAAPVLPSSDYWLTQFHGDYLREMTHAEEKLGFGTKVLDSKLGVRAHYYSNPSFVLAVGGRAQEESGQVIGGTLAWSGSYQFQFEVDPDRRLRAICGMNPYGSQYHLKPGEQFTTPAMIWGWSGEGKGPLSRNFHRWARKYGVRPRSGPRPVLLNNWEATYFDFDEPKLVSLFDGARSLGLELFLLDDGWFGNKYPRDNDRAGLGDWEPNRRKLPRGISALAAEAKRRGLRFGIWVEPEMVNPRSELFEAHPEWVIRQPKRELDLYRSQLILDLTRPAVREFVFKTVDDLLTNNPGISYVKWDCNRYVTQPGSPYLPAEEQSHLWIDYTRSLYDIMGRVARRHPNVEVMICSGGAGRVDYGALRYGTEFWPSDNTDPVARVGIQWGYSHFFPASAMGAHVTHMGNRPLKLAFDVAMGGCLGMDLDLARLSPADRRLAERAVATYKDVRDVVQQGDLYRLESPYEGDRSSLMYVSEDQARALVLAYQMKDAPGAPGPLVLRGLDPHRHYRVRELNLPEGKASLLDVEGRLVSGAALLREGLRPPTRRQYESAAIELSSTSAAPAGQ
jgi:alpha-galactosidase